MRPISALVFALFCISSLSAQEKPKDKDWSGKLALLKSEEVKLCDKDGKELEAEGEHLTADIVYKILSDDGTRLELVGKTGFISRDDAIPVDDAIAYFTDKIKAKPKEAKFHGRRGLAYWYKGRNDIGIAPGADVTGEVESAMADITEAIRLDRENYLWWYQRAWLHLLRHEPDRAISDCDEAIRLKSDWSEVFRARGSARTAKKEFDKAIEDYTEALRLDPDSADTFNSRGLLWQTKNELDKALEDYTQAIELNPKSAIYFNNRGMIWSAKGQYAKALEDFNQALERDPKSSMTFNNRGNLWQAKQDYDKAVADYTKAIEFDPKNAMALLNRGDVWGLKRDSAKAIADYSKVIESDPKVPPLTALADTSGMRSAKAIRPSKT